MQNALTAPEPTQTNLAPMKQLLQAFQQAHPALAGQLGGVPDCGWALAIAALARQHGRAVLCLVASRGDADRLVDDLQVFLSGPTPLASPDDIRPNPYALLFPEIEMSIFDEGVADPERLQVLNDLKVGQPAVVVVPLLALLQPAAPAKSLRRRILRVGDTMQHSEMVDLLREWHYTPAPQVLEPGQFCDRGQVVDFYPSNGMAKRLEFADGKIMEIRAFAVDTQRTVAQLEAFALPSMLEPKRSGHLIDYFPADALVVLVEESRLRFRLNEMSGAAEAGWKFSNYQDAEILQHHEHKEWEELDAMLGERPRVTLQASETATMLSIEAAPKVQGLGQLVDWCGQSKPAESVYLVTNSERRVRALLRRRGLEAVQVEKGILSQGFSCAGVGVVFSDHELFGTTHRPRYEAAPSSTGPDLTGFAAGDLVVHAERGIGRFEGLVPVDLAGHRRDLIKLSYANDDTLMVPPEQVDHLTLYRGGEDQQPALSRLGTSVWQRTRAKADREIAAVAELLRQRQHQREDRQAQPVGGECALLEELEAAFPFEETPSQLQAIAQIKADLEKTRAMDRLLCGDVGYGKTEVALRACFKVVCAEMQAALLVPTTVLAQQHFELFRSRMEPLGVEVVGLWGGSGDHQEVLHKLVSGQARMVVGTHRLLSDDIAFKNLGLLVVDEEQQFGTHHKERLQEIAQSVHMLSMSATPIPRTMQLSLAGLRDISLLDAPPAARRPVRTYLLEPADKYYLAALMRELERHGQAFVLHNKVDELPTLAENLRKLLGRARVAVAHGQMEAGELEQVLQEFGEREHDVLVCSTIIESGVNFPNCNTIVIKDAHRFGLSQLYQIRGRVGRADRQAYCYLMGPKKTEGAKPLTEKARLRLETIREFTELGSGFHVALRDLEIRGAGDLLGGDQSGQISHIGYGLYSELLQHALHPDPEGAAPPRCVIELPVDCYLPTEYLLEVSARIEIYRRLSVLRKPGQIDKLQEEVVDRFGRLPQPVLSLFQLARLRLLAVNQHFNAIHFKDQFGETSVVCDGAKGKSERTLAKPPKGPGVLDWLCRELTPA